MGELDRAAIAEMFARARDADLEAVAGVKLFRAGRRMRGECPLCGASKGKRGDGAFSADVDAGWWKCWACSAGGDVIDLEQLLRGGSLREAAERLAGPAAIARPAQTRRSEPRRVEGEKPPRLAFEIWTGARSGIWESPVETYLRGRGLREPVLRRAAHELRNHHAAKWGWDEREGRWITAPAMVASPFTPAGATGGIHVTYLRPDGSGKARLDPAKRMWGPQRDVEGRPGGVWLSHPASPGPLIVGEGIESTLSAMQLVAEERGGGPVRGVATLSLEALQGGLATDKWGRVDLDQPRADPERPAFTWPLADLATAEVLIAVDRDMKPIRRKVRKLGGGTAEVELDSEARARLCAGLAVQAWKAAGANAVRVIAPAAGRDFNDELKARVGA